MTDNNEQIDEDGLELKTLLVEEFLSELADGKLKATDLTSENLIFALLKFCPDDFIKDFTISFPDWDKLETEDYNIFVLPSIESNKLVTNDGFTTRSLIQIQLTTKEEDGFKAMNQLRKAERIILDYLFAENECSYRNIEYSGSDFVEDGNYTMKIRTLSFLIDNPIISLGNVRTPNFKLKNVAKNYKVV